MDPEDLAVNHIALDKEHEAVKRFVLSLPVDASGSVLELEGRAVACVVPIAAEPGPANGAWSEAKNARRCALIDKEIDGTLAAGEAMELHLLQRRCWPIAARSLRCRWPRRVSSARNCWKRPGAGQASSK